MSTCAEHRDGVKRGAMVLSLNSGACLTSCVPLSQIIKHFEPQFPQPTWEQIKIPTFQYSCEVHIKGLASAYQIGALCAVAVVVIVIHMIFI